MVPSLPLRAQHTLAMRTARPQVAQSFSLFLAGSGSATLSGISAPEGRRREVLGSILRSRLMIKLERFLTFRNVIVRAKNPAAPRHLCMHSILGGAKPFVSSFPNPGLYLRMAGVKTAELSSG